MEFTWPYRRIWLLIPAASVVPAVLDAGQMWLKETVDGNPVTNWGNVVFQGVEWLFLGALTPIAWYLARAFPLGRADWRRSLAAHFAGALVLCGGWATLGFILARWLEHWVADGPIQQAYMSWFLTSVPWSVFMYFTVLGCVHAFSYYHLGRERELQAARLSALLAEAQLGALRMQLQPHFLFNSLNTLAVLVREDKTQLATRMLELLGDLLRRLVRVDRPQEVRLEEEIRFVEEYLEIELLRFPDRLHVVWSIHHSARNALVPDMLLQPLVENAIRHGVASRVGPTRLEIAARCIGDLLRLEVSDTGGPTTPVQGEGVGLANTRERLRTLYGSAASLTLEPLANGGTRATVDLPLHTGPE